MCHKKNGGIDGWKSRIHAWKLVLTSAEFKTFYGFLMGLWLVMDGSTLVSTL